MENLKEYKTNVKKTATLFLTISFLLISGISCSQKPADFSGKWILNNSKSSSVFANTSSIINITQEDFKIDLEITQNQKDAKPTVRTVNYMIGGSMAMAKPFKNNPNHKETTITQEWGSNKQSFIIKEITTVFVENETPKKSTNIKVYSLSDGGKTLTIKSDDTLPEGSITPESERHSIQIFNKSR